MNYIGKDHTFSVCAFGESEYLESCIRSLEEQTVKSRIIICTATPNEHIRRIARAHHLPLYIRKKDPQIAQDWSFGIKKAETPLVTLAHQDDLYEPAYLEKSLMALSRAEHPLISFTDYYEIRNGERTDPSGSRMLRIKKLMLLPLRCLPLQKSIWCRRRILSMGNPICCPSVTYVKDHLPERLFSTRFPADLDWEAWEKLSRKKGSFCYINETLMGHRIHEQSATSQVIGEGRNRSGEDLEMYRKFWPEPVARGLNHFYARSQDENRVRS